MKQFNYEITEKHQIDDVLKLIHESINGSNYSGLLFHLYTIKFNENEITFVQESINSAFPKAIIAGTSSNGDICEGHLADFGMVIALSVFESTEIDYKYFECPLGQEESIGEQILQFINQSPNIKAAEILITLKSINSKVILSKIEKRKSGITIFGAGSAAFIISDTNTRIFDKNSITPNGAIIITYSGDNFNIEVHHAIGWKRLGKDLTVTKIAGKRLYELDHIPAGRLYSKYLDIKPDENFFNNILEFPLMSSQHGIDVMRLPYKCIPEDGSIILAADVDKGSPVNLSYGDPEVIKTDVIKLIRDVHKFHPEAIFLYSCGVRRLYWKYLINKETGYFSTIAPVAGFYSSGEIMNFDEHIIEHHVTLIAICIREGDAKEVASIGRGDRELPIPEEQQIHPELSMVRRLANFINVTSSELMEANRQLQEIAETDELTGLYNRRMINRLVYDSLKRANKYNINMVMGILDIDDFKEINDTYGHSSGDYVLKTISSIMETEIEKLPSGILGRWGGEEFLFLAPTLALDDIYDNLEEARQRICNINYVDIGKRTVSVGVTSFIQGDTMETLFKRADDALYMAKNTGKNKMCRK